MGYFTQHGARSNKSKAIEKSQDFDELKSSLPSDWQGFDPESTRFWAVGERHVKPGKDDTVLFYQYDRGVCTITHIARVLSDTRDLPALSEALGYDRHGSYSHVFPLELLWQGTFTELNEDEISILPQLQQWDLSFNKVAPELGGILGGLLSRTSGEKMIESDKGSEEDEVSASEWPLARFMREKGFVISLPMLINYYLSLKTKPFVLLAGISGTGKTLLTRHFAEALNSSKQSGEVRGYKLIPVRPNWQGKDDLLGFYNLLTKQYHSASFLTAMLEAEQSVVTATSTADLAPWIEDRFQKEDWIPTWHMKAGKFLQEHADRTREHYEKMSEKDFEEVREYLWQRNNDLANIGQGSPRRKIENRVLKEVTAVLADKSLSFGQRYSEALRIYREEDVPAIPWAATLRAMVSFADGELCSVADPKAVKALLNLFKYDPIKSMSDPKEVQEKLTALPKEMERLMPDADKYKRVISAWLLYEGVRDKTLPRNAFQTTPFFVCVDEMNLARVEHYFSDILSVMETRRRTSNGQFETDQIALHSGKESVSLEDGTELLSSIRIPDNLFVSGTVNMDETTHAFSKKVLDRANSIEFSDVDLSTLPEPIGEFDLGDETRAELRSDFMNRQYREISNVLESKGEAFVLEWVERLRGINAVLENSDIHFAYRVRDEVIKYMSYADDFIQLSRSKGWAMEGFDMNTAFDYQVMQKVLPRISGTREELSDVLESLEKVLKEMPMEMSLRKISQMRDKLLRVGFTSYWMR